MTSTSRATADPRAALLEMERALRHTAALEVEAAVPSRLLLFKGSDDQPRDERGRWTAPGGGVVTAPAPSEVQASIESQTKPASASEMTKAWSKAFIAPDGTLRKFNGTMDSHENIAGNALHRDESADAVTQLGHQYGYQRVGVFNKDIALETHGNLTAAHADTVEDLMYANPDKMLVWDHYTTPTATSRITVATKPEEFRQSLARQGLAKMRERKYTEDQPRDDNGRFAGGGAAVAEPPSKSMGERLTDLNYPETNKYDFFDKANENARGGFGSAAFLTPQGTVHDIKRAEHDGVIKRLEKSGATPAEASGMIQILATHREANLRIFSKPTQAQVDAIHDLHAAYPDRSMHHDIYSGVHDLGAPIARGVSMDRLHDNLGKVYGMTGLTTYTRPNSGEQKYSEDQPRDERGRFGSGGGESATAADAEALTRSLPGVEEVMGAGDAPLIAQNTVNRGLSRMADAGYGLPKAVEYTHDPDPAERDTVAKYDPMQDRMTINLEHSFWQDPEKNGARDERVGRTSHGAAEQPIVHELGHKAHYDTAGSWGSVSTFGGPSGRNADAEQDTAMKVSSYAGYAPNEFVAETFAGKLLGKDYPSDVNALYDRYHGPPVSGPLKTRAKSKRGELLPEGLRHVLRNGQVEHVLERGVGLTGHRGAQLLEGGHQRAVRGVDVPRALGPIRVAKVRVDVVHESKYSEEQPRDERGRFAGGSLSAPAPMATPEPYFPGTPAAGDAAALAREEAANKLLNDGNQSREDYKSRIAGEIATRLEGNPEWEHYVERAHPGFEFALNRDSPGARSLSQASTSDLVGNWATSSGDNFPPSVAMQQAIKDEFGLRDAATDHLQTQPSREGPGPDELYAQNGGAYRAFARAMYDNTQADLASKGIKEMTLYRGLGWGPDASSQVHMRPNEPDPKTGLTFDGQAHTVTTTAQPASSWSYSWKQAQSFASGESEPGAMLAATVPATRILSTMNSGFGAKPENEVVVLGGKDEVRSAAWPGTQTARDIYPPNSPGDLLSTKARAWSHLERKYSEDQARDDHGRFSSDGGGGAVTSSYHQQPPPNRDSRNDATYDMDMQLHRDLGAYPRRVGDDDSTITKVDPATAEIYDAKQNMFHNFNEVEGTRRPLDYVYRSVSGEDWQGIQARGYMQSDSRMNIETSEGTVAKPLEPAPFYLPHEGPGHILKVAVKPEDNWRIDTDGYAKTPNQIPLDRIVGVSHFMDGLATTHASQEKSAAVANLGGERKYSPDQERDERGRFGSGGGGGTSSAASAAVGAVPKTGGRAEGKGTLEDPKYVDSDLDMAAREIYAGNHVRLDQKEQVSTLVDKMGDMAKDAVARGEKAPTYDLGKVTVPGTNLFTQESLGIPRVEMPQLSGVPLPGTPAARMTGDVPGAKINLGDHFRDTLEQQGYKVTDERVPAENLRATQMDLVGPQVAGMSRSLDAGTLNIRPIFVSKDNYVVDGHHQWAATVLSNIRAGQQEHDLPVQRVNADIGTILDTSRAYTKAMGLPEKSGVAKTVAAIKALFARLERRYQIDEARPVVEYPVDEPERPIEEWTYDSPGSTYGDYDTWLRIVRRKVREMRRG